MPKSKIIELLETIGKDTVTKQDLENMIRQIMLFLQDFKTSQDQKAAQNKASLAADAERYLSEMKKFHSEVHDKMHIVEKPFKAEADTVRHHMKEEIEKLRKEMPSEYDDAPMKEEMHARIGQMDKRLTGILTRADVDAIIKPLKDEIETLRRRPPATGGGVTNMRIAQAFKYIARTEQPTGSINGSNTVYTVTQPIFAVLSFSLNGETIAQLPNYTISGRSITFSSALPAAYSGKDFEIKYIAA